MGRNSLYLLLSAACLMGYIWLALNFSSGGWDTRTDLCMFKHITGIPCPSCGATRAVLALAAGNISEALLLNPLGFIIAAIMLISPLWIGYDLLKRQSTLLGFYIRTELFLKKRQFAIPAILLVAVNWAWSIYKDL